MFTVIIQGENESGFFLHLHHIFFLYQYDFIILRFDDFKLSEKKKHPDIQADIVQT